MTKLSDASQVKEDLNKAYYQLSKVRSVSKLYPLTDAEYIRLLDVFKLMGMIRSDHLKREEQFAG